MRKILLPLAAGLLVFTPATAAPGPSAALQGTPVGSNALVPGQGATVQLPGQPRIKGNPGQSSSAAPAPARRTVSRLAPGFDGRWSTYHPAPGSGLQSLSGSALVGLNGLDLAANGDHSDGIPDAFPGTGVPRLPAGFAPNAMVNQDRSALSHNETSVAIDPRNPRHIVAGANDYRLGQGSSGFYTSFDAGSTWYDGVLPYPTVYLEPPTYPLAPQVPRTLDALDGGGDASIAFDRDGTVYYAEINFHRFGCISGVFIFRSTNGGQTWSRPLAGTVGKGDTRVSGDGVPVANTNDHDCSNFYDKEMITAGPRPTGAALVANSDPAHISQDRLYVTYSDFTSQPFPAVVPYTSAAAQTLESPIMISYSDDQGRHWSTPASINGSDAGLCAVQGSANGTTGVGTPPATTGLNQCVSDQGSDPAVDPATGAVYVTFNNGDNSAADCPGQVLLVSSPDGGVTWTNPTQVGCQVEALPSGGATGADGKAVCEGTAGSVLSGLCFRVPFETSQSIAINPRDGSLHVTFDDNRNGGTDWYPPASGSYHPSDVDVFSAASRDHGKTFSPPVRVNQDPKGDGRDQFFPWSTFGPDGTYYVSFMDRSLDPAGHLIGYSLAISHDNGASFRQEALSSGLSDGQRCFRLGLFMGDYTGLAASSLGAYAIWPDTRRSGATPNIADAKAHPANPSEFWSDLAGGASYSIPGGSGSVLAASAQGAQAAANPPRAQGAVLPAALPNTAARPVAMVMALGFLGGLLLAAPLLWAGLRRRRRLGL